MQKGPPAAVLLHLSPAKTKRNRTPRRYKRAGNSYNILHITLIRESLGLRNDRKLYLVPLLGARALEFCMVAEPVAPKDANQALLPWPVLS